MDQRKIELDAGFTKDRALALTASHKLTEPRFGMKQAHKDEEITKLLFRAFAPRQSESLILMFHFSVDAAPQYLKKPILKNWATLAPPKSNLSET